MTVLEETPNAGRVYDYLLGGEHNLELDRQAAEYLLHLVPSMRKWIRMLRAFMHQTVVRLAEQGFDRFLDLGSGLPTKEHIHSAVPGARVVYTDRDPVIVAYAADILGHQPNARYLRADIRDLASILRSSVVHEMLGDASKVAIGFNAVTCFLNDDEIRRLARDLYDWAPKGSKMFATFETKAEDRVTPRMQELVDTLGRMGSPYHFLTLPRSEDVVRPWRAEEPGFRPLAEWLGLERDMTIDDREGVDLEFYGAILTKD